MLQQQHVKIVQFIMNLKEEVFVLFAVLDTLVQEIMLVVLHVIHHVVNVFKLQQIVQNVPSTTNLLVQDQLAQLAL